MTECKHKFNNGPVTLECIHCGQDFVYYLTTEVERLESIVNSLLDTEDLKIVLNCAEECEQDVCIKSVKKIKELLEKQ